MQTVQGQGPATTDEPHPLHGANGTSPHRLRGDGSYSSSEGKAGSEERSGRCGPFYPLRAGICYQEPYSQNDSAGPLQ